MRQICVDRLRRFVWSRDHTNKDDTFNFERFMSRKVHYHKVKNSNTVSSKLKRLELVYV